MNAVRKEVIPRLMIAGTGSGCGKTTVTCALLKALLNRGKKVASFKCGPDYIDPMFHSEIIGAKSRNLDFFLCGEKTVKYLFASNSQEMDCSLVEGVMGFYDGIGASSAEASSWDISQRLGIPAVLVVSCQGMSLSLGAVVKGYRKFMDNRIQGVIINGCSAMMYPRYREMIREHTGLETYGYLPNMPEAAIESRHLGLVTAEEIGGLQEKIRLLGEAAEKSLDLDGLLTLAESAEPFAYEEMPVVQKGHFRIGVARDRAFCFYYEDSLDLLRRMGAELVEFSPLADEKIPENLDGLIFGGGYPELYPKKLSENERMLQSIRRAAGQGIPIYGECGGFMYLQEAIADGEGNSYPMVGIFPGESRLGNHLSRFGYVTLTAGEDTLLCRKGEQINAHEFHYSDSTQNGKAFHAQKPSSVRGWDCIQSEKNRMAGFPHIHFWGNPGFAEQFADRALEYQAFHRR